MHTSSKALPRLQPVAPPVSRARPPVERCVLCGVMLAEFGWRLAALDDPGLPEFIARRALPDPATARCELCDARPRQPLSTILVVDRPDGLPVPFLICAQCRRTLDELHALLEAAARPPAT